MKMKWSRWRKDRKWRKWKTTLLCGLVLFNLLAAGCSQAKPQVNNTSAFTAQEALKKFKSRYISDFPDQPGEWQTVYRNIGGKPPGLTIRFQVETLVDAAGNNAYIFTFKETWNSYDYNPDHVDKPILQHESKVKITPTTITFLSESGDREPNIP